MFRTHITEQEEDVLLLHQQNLFQEVKNWMTQRYSSRIVFLVKQSKDFQGCEEILKRRIQRKEEEKHSTYNTPLPVHKRESQSNHFVDKVTNKLCLYRSKFQASEGSKTEDFQEGISRTRRRRSSVAATATVVTNKESLGEDTHS